MAKSTCSHGPLGVVRVVGCVSETLTGEQVVRYQFGGPLPLGHLEYNLLDVFFNHHFRFPA